MKKIHYKTVIISDLHLGTPESRVDALQHFFEHITFNRLILNGDILDLWHMKWSFRWIRRHMQFVKFLVKKIESAATEVIYVRGNHDDALEQFLPFTVKNLKIVKEYIHITPKGKYLVVHGDDVDFVSLYHRWVEHIGGWFYTLLLKLNRYYNMYRAWLGKEYVSISRPIKTRVKSVVNAMSDRQNKLKQLAKDTGCIGVMSGHTHIPEDVTIDGIHFLNSGDWVETMTALVEKEDGTIHLLEYQDFCRELEREVARGEL